MNNDTFANGNVHEEPDRPYAVLRWRRCRRRRWLNQAIYILLLGDTNNGRGLKPPLNPLLENKEGNMALYGGRPLTTQQPNDKD